MGGLKRMLSLRRETTSARDPCGFSVLDWSVLGGNAPGVQAVLEVRSALQNC
jgi:hypothetical protein